jgi:aarF domain-containing kinase
MRMVQGNNQTLGSPSNRINILAQWAIEGYNMNRPSLAPLTPFLMIQNPTLIRSYLISQAQSVLFRVTLFAIDLGFALNRVRAFVLLKFGGRKEEGFEDLLQRQVSSMARDELGIELDDSAFQG